MKSETHDKYDCNKYVLDGEKLVDFAIFNQKDMVVDL
jgi:hypothetical protein